MSYTGIFEILDNLNLKQYKSEIQTNLLDDDTLFVLLSSGILVEQLKEVIPPLAHRLFIITELNRRNELEISNNSDVLSSHPDGRQEEEPQDQVKCTDCSTQLISNWECIWKHLRYFHLITQTKIYWTCPYCHSGVLRFRNFKIHVMKHIKSQDKTTKFSKHVSVPCPANEEIVYEKSELQSNEDQIEAETGMQIEDEIKNLRISAVKFVVQLKGNGKLPLSVCQDIMTNVTRLANYMVDIAKKIVRRKSEFSATMEFLELLKNPFSSVASDYLLKKYLTEIDVLIPNEEVVLGSHLKIIKGKAATVFDTLQFVPIERILQKVLNTPGVMSSIMDINRNIHNNVYTSPVSGKYLRAKLTECDVPVVFLLFYYDEVEVCNPLGSRHGSHKLGNFYFSILNTYRKYSSNLDNIYLCCTFKTTLLKKYTISQILERPVAAITNLCKQRMFVNCDSFKGDVKISLGQVTGDNLGLHQIFGFSESFVCNYPCRFCRMRFILDTSCAEELLQIQTWLKINRGPPQKVFEKLNQSYYTRKSFIKRSSDFSSIISEWPRLFDMDGAIQNDFNFEFPLTADNLFLQWNIIADKILSYCEVMKRLPSTLGIFPESAKENPHYAALFMLAFLIRPKNRRVSQASSVDSFIHVFPEANNINTLLQEKSSNLPEVVAIGTRGNLLFDGVFVLLKGKAVKCENLLEAIDLAFKSFYVFNIEFSPSCYGAWQFLDFAIYKMKPMCPILSSVKELAAFVSTES